jgi:kinesin family protein 1
MRDAQTVLTPPAEAAERMRGSSGSRDGSRKVFAFDKSYWSFDKADSNYAGQQALHGDLGVPLLDNAFQGYNNCIFAYGQTGSGKSYSMMGYGAEAGVIPKICQDMFARIDAAQQDVNLKCTVEVSYLEIYNERVRDLLNPSTKGNLKVREHPSTGPYVEDLAKLAVSGFEEIEQLMDEGNKARTVAATNMNETSSRSHAVFTLTLSQKRFDVDTSMSTEKAAKISLVDLAGSERATSTGATGARLKEGAEINRSLSTLGRVIAALADLDTPGKKKKGIGSGQVPYRDSVLTWLLKDSLGGNSMTAMIATISPADINFEETLSTLRYADSAKRIKNHAVVNEDANARMVRELKEELAQLRSKLSSSGGVGSEQNYPDGTPLHEQFVSIVQADGSVKQVSKAEIAEQLSQSEKLYSDLNQTWEEKLQKTEEIHKEREAVLEELGISIEKGFVGLHTPKKMPHLVNLSDDPLLAECLVYNLKPGTTTVGNVNAGSNAAEIRLNGSRILSDHCNFENTDNIVTVVPKKDAPVMVNGNRITGPARLRSGNRIILGDFHIFRFNNPMETRAERAEHSLLRQSMAANLPHMDKGTPSPSPRPAHERHLSALSDVDWEGSRPESPSSRKAPEFDWSYARREAAGAILGPDQKITGLTDDELNVLFEDVQRARAERQSKDEDDMESTTSLQHDRYGDDPYSADTAPTMPCTPQPNDPDAKLRESREELQLQLRKQREGFEAQLRASEVASAEQLRASEIASAELEAVRRGKAEMEIEMSKVEKLNAQLEMQRREFEALLKSSRPRVLDEADIASARRTYSWWKKQRYVQLAETILNYGGTLKEAQVMSQAMKKDISFQFAIVDSSCTLSSSYDMVAHGIPSDDDPALEEGRRPCIAIRVIDYENQVVRLWSVAKFEDRVRVLRQLYQYLDRPDHVKHFSTENPFAENCLPRYSLVAEVDVPLAAVLESRVKDYGVDMYSPYTHMSVGRLQLSLEPSTAQAPLNTIKFNVVLHEVVGFPEREGTQVHAQLSIPGVSESGVTATQMMEDFDEGSIKFESVHGLGVPLGSPRDTLLRVSLFARITSMHLDKLTSWDQIRDPRPSVEMLESLRQSAAAVDRKTKEHDVFARVRILELEESGEYAPVEVVSTHDTGCFQLHQGLQRRISVSLSHDSGTVFECGAMSNFRVSNVVLVDSRGREPDLHGPDSGIQLKITQSRLESGTSGAVRIDAAGQWDSGLHESLLLDRVTADRYRVRMTLSWDYSTAKLPDPLAFSTQVFVQIVSRSHVRSPYTFRSLWLSSVKSSVATIFAVSFRARSGLGSRGLEAYDYIKGEESLCDWTPRSLSLIHDFFDAARRRRRVAEVDSTLARLDRETLSVKRVTLSDPVYSPVCSDCPVYSDRPVYSDHPVYSDRQRALLVKCIELWPVAARLGIADSTASLAPTSLAPTSLAAPTSPPAGLRIVAAVRAREKAKVVLRAGQLLVLDGSRWVRRHVELRALHLHLYAVEGGDELGLVGLGDGRVDSEPMAGRVDSAMGGLPAGVEVRWRCVFALCRPGGRWLFCARSERDRAEWILAIDRAYVDSC